MSTASRKAGLVILSGIALGVASWLIPAPTTGAQTGLAFHIPLLIETLLATISVGGGILFLTGLNGFKQKLRVAYAMIAFGMVFYALALVQLPILQATGLLNSAYVTYGWLNILYVIAAVLLFAGFRRYADLIQARTWLLRPATTVMAIALVAASTLLIQHYQSFYSALAAERINIALSGATAAILTITSAGILVVKQTVGPAYVNALAWSLIGVGFLAASTISTVYFELHGWTGAYVTSGAFFLPYLAGVLCNLRSAVAFNNITRY